MFRRLLPLLLLGAFLAPAGRVAADEAKEPYKIRIVVQTTRNRMLTKLFREQVAQEVADGLQAALGDLAKVEATTKPLEAGELRQRSDYKTHFVHIDLARAAYTITTRQHDGLTGLYSPVMRRGRTSDPAYVARTAALLIEEDLGLLGTVESEPDAQGLVQLRLKGGALDVDLGKWIKKGEVFGLAEVLGDSVGHWVPWAVLRVEEAPRDGVCTCRYFSRYKLRRVAGLKGVLLGTRKGPLRLRLMQEKNGKLVKMEGSVTLQIRRHGFEGEDATRLSITTNGAKDIDTSTKGANGRFDKLAFISVLSGETLRARIPAPLIDDGLILLPVPAGGGEDGNLAAFRFRALKNSVIDSYRVQIDLFEEINKRTAKPEERAKALATVRSTLERCRQDYERLTAELDEVRKEITKLPDRDRPGSAEMAAIEKRLKLIKSGETDLMRHLTLLEKIEKEESDPKRKEAKIQIERAKALEKEAEIGQAIAIYEKIPPELRPAGLDKRIAKLKEQWERDKPKLREARHFIYNVWPTLENATAISERIKEAFDALDVCEKNSDVFGPAKLLKATDKHAERLAKEFDALKPDVNLEDEKPAQVIKELSPKLRDLFTRAQKYLERSKKD
jgi:hypothetical protein